MSLESLDPSPSSRSPCKIAAGPGWRSADRQFSVLLPFQTLRQSTHSPGSTSTTDSFTPPQIQMSSSSTARTPDVLPWAYHTFFTIIEPALTLGGVGYSVLFPHAYHAELVPVHLNELASGPSTSRAGLASLWRFGGSAKRWIELLSAAEDGKAFGDTRATACGAPPAVGDVGPSTGTVMAIRQLGSCQSILDRTLKDAQGARARAPLTNYRVPRLLPARLTRFDPLAPPVHCVASRSHISTLSRRASTSRRDQPQRGTTRKHRLELPLLPRRRRPHRERAAPFAPSRADIARILTHLTRDTNFSQHIGFTLYDLGPFVTDPSTWTTLVWGNVGITSVLFVVRTLWFLGVGRDRLIGRQRSRQAVRSKSD